MRICILFAAAVFSPQMSGIVRAATFSTPIGAFAADSSGEFSVGIFDFGLSFSSIERASIEVTMPTGLSPGSCNGSACHITSLDVILYDPDEEPQFDHYVPSVPPEPYPSLYGSFSYILPNRASRAYISPLNPYTGFGPPPFAPEWPNFSLNGYGAVGVQEVTHWFCQLNCSGSGTNVDAPRGITSARLIVEGVAVPEPSTVVLLSLMAVTLSCPFVRNSNRLRR